jgi:phosphatidylglycerophosphatase A
MRLSKWIATFFGLGYMPLAPGTFGAIGALGLSFLLSQLTKDVFLLSGIHLCLIVFFYMAGVWACRNLETAWGKDPSRVVVDEAIGYWIGLLFVPLSAKTLLVVLVLFRFFDIVKPLGIRHIDRMHSPHAVMLDDVLAGFYTLILVQIGHYFQWIP